jgi:hypothetical protein
VSRAFSSVSIALLVWAATTPARAYEDQASVDAEVAYVHAFSKEFSPRNGVAVGAGASLGLSNVLSLRGQLMWAFHPSRDPLVSFGWVSAELVYLIDVLEVVPYFGAGVDFAALVRSGADAELNAGLHPVIGFDYLVSRELTLGLQVRPVFLLTAIDTMPVYLQVGVTLSYLFDT